MQSSTASGLPPGTIAESIFSALARKPAPDTARSPAPPLAGPIPAPRAASAVPLFAPDLDLDLTPSPPPTAPIPSTPAPTHRPRRGRATLFGPEFAELILQLVRVHGLAPTAAAEEVGISRSTMSRWRLIYPDFDQRLAFARSDYRRLRLGIIRGACTKDGRPDWRAAAWELEHAFPEDYCMNPKRRAAFQAQRAADDAAHEAMIEAYDANPESFYEDFPESTPADAAEFDEPEPDFEFEPAPTSHTTAAPSPAAQKFQNSPAAPATHPTTPPLKAAPPVPSPATAGPLSQKLHNSSARSPQPAPRHPRHSSEKLQNHAQAA